ncbi:hypothetical protein [Rubritalea tangerina]|uniref:hypothetical protein n=1 Tax=Rubritalea tangerina TaxID=430798 RepID=UPI00360E01E9
MGRDACPQSSDGARISKNPPPLHTSASLLSAPQILKEGKHLDLAVIRRNRGFPQLLAP